MSTATQPPSPVQAVRRCKKARKHLRDAFAFLQGALASNDEENIGATETLINHAWNKLVRLQKVVKRLRKPAVVAG